MKKINKFPAKQNPSKAYHLWQKWIPIAFLSLYFLFLTPTTLSASYYKDCCNFNTLPYYCADIDKCCTYICAMDDNICINTMCDPNTEHCQESDKKCHPKDPDLEPPPEVDCGSPNGKCCTIYEDVLDCQVGYIPNKDRNNPSCICIKEEDPSPKPPSGPNITCNYERRESTGQLAILVYIKETSKFEFGAEICSSIQHESSTTPRIAQCKPIISYDEPLCFLFAKSNFDKDGNWTARVYAQGYIDGELNPNVCTPQNFTAKSEEIDVPDKSVSYKPQPCSAYGGPGIQTALGCIPTELNAFIKWILSFAISIAGGISFLMIIFGGFQIITSTGNPEKLEQGKQILNSAITGLLLIIFSTFLLKTIGVTILNIPGFK